MYYVLVKLCALLYIDYMILFRYILRNHAAPFLFSIISLFCIFLLQFLMKFADRLVGKGLETWVIIKLIVYSLAWMVVLVVPMAILVATLMAFGSMSQNNEITIIKSSGTNLYKMMIPPLFMSIIIGYLLLLFNNDVLPDANHKLKFLMQDISNKKPTLSLEPGVFSQEVSNYAILVRHINEKTNTLRDITIYDYNNPSRINVVTAEKGKIFFSKDQSKLIMDLTDGEIHESQVGQTGLYRKLVFKKHRITMDADQFSFRQTTPGGPRGDRELSADDMLTIIDSLSTIKEQYKVSLNRDIDRYFLLDSTYNPYKAQYVKKGMTQAALYAGSLEKIRSARNVVLSSFKRVEYIRNQIDEYWVEVHKKYALPVACIVFVLIGAPLGVMVKKGGFGVAASISLFFFLIYWAFLIGGEKLGNRNIIAPFWGMWSANILIGAAGIVLTIMSVRETVTINFNWFRKFMPKQWRTEEESEQQ